MHICIGIGYGVDFGRSYLAPLKYMALQVLDSYSDGVYLYFLDMLCAI